MVPDITQLLSRWRRGDEGAFSELFPLLYGELRRLAQSYLNQENAGHTLQSTALVHEAYLRLLGQHEVDWQSRGHFFAVAAQAMRRILVDHARKQTAGKRRGAVVSLEEGLVLGADLSHFTELDEALTRLSEMDARRAQVVEMRFFGGMSGEEIASHLAVSPATVQRDWLIARAWLYRELNPSAQDHHGQR
ncbi:MAG: sigma-70 family RNA polymerase sigma factor [Acidobacteria bacterium]|nr:sigma-70 family RNA polymerase sigma factor [Acidobacteriota bacterium]